MNVEELANELDGIDNVQSLEVVVEVETDTGGHELTEYCSVKVLRWEHSEGRVVLEIDQY